MKNGSAGKFILLVLIAAAIAGIWFYKNAAEQRVEMAAAEDSDFALHVTAAVDLEQLKSYGLPIIIDFGADSCIPCKEMAPVLRELNAELRGKAIIKFVDVWKYEELLNGFPISSIPTQVFIGADGKPYSPQDPDALLLRLYTAKDTGEHIFTTHEGGLSKGELMGILAEMGVN